MQTRTLSIPTIESRVARGSRRQELSHRTGFWVVAAAFLVSTGFTVVTTPLWTIYQRRDGFDTFMVTVAFASYAVGVLVSLFLAGHVSDWLGRRRILLPAILLEALAAVMFLVWNDLPGLIAARFVTGLGLGMLTATATAYVAELHARAHPERGGARADIVATAANIGGFGVGVIIASALVGFAPAPVDTPFVVFLVLLLLAALVVAFVPETVTPPARRRPYRPQRVQIPAAARTRYFAAATLAFAGFSVLGLFTSLAPSFIAGQLHVTSPLIGGGVVFATFASAASVQIGIRRLSATASVLAGTALFVVGSAAIVGGVLTVSLPLFTLAGVLAGGGAGVLFSSAITAAAHAAAPDGRGEALAGIFLAGYLGLAIPVVGLGATTLLVSMAAALAGFSAVVVAIAVIGTVVFLTSPSRPRETAPTASTRR